MLEPAHFFITNDLNLCTPRILCVLSHPPERLSLAPDRPVAISADPDDDAAQVYVATRVGKRRPAAADERRASQVEVAVQTHKFGPLIFCFSLSPVPIDP